MGLSGGNVGTKVGRYVGKQVGRNTHTSMYITQRMLSVQNVDLTQTPVSLT